MKYNTYTISDIKIGETVALQNTDFCYSKNTFLRSGIVDALDKAVNTF
jgi:hypothetical protein